MKRMIPLLTAFVLCFVPMYLLTGAIADTGSGSALVDAGAGSGSAVAAPVVVPDPIANPADSISLLSKLYHGGQIASLLIVGAFLVLTVLEAKVAWFQVGKRKIYATAVIGGLGLIVTAAANGTTPNLSMVFGALTTAVALALKPSSSSS